MTASLHHARSILAAAINAGFRESGVQSLKNLDHADAFPMIAIRSSGLAFESIIGYTDEDLEYNERIQSLVTGEYLGYLVDIANERFVTNTQRIRRFEEELFGRNDALSWENAESRKARRRAEGLMQQALARQSKPGNEISYSKREVGIMTDLPINEVE